MRKLMPCAALALVAAGASVTVAPATAGSTGGHCPPPSSGYVVWDIDAPAYAADDDVDAKGNGNGYVCAKPMKLVDDGTGGLFQLYNFIDDSGTGSSH